MIRTGRKGQREAYNLEQNVITIGWSWLGDISKIDNKEELRELQQQVDPEHPNKTSSGYTTKLWQFFDEMEIGDLIVMPSKVDHAKVYVGRIKSSYSYDHSTDPQFSHQREVKWLGYFERNDLTSEALNTFKSPHSVFQIHHKPFLEFLRAFVSSKHNPENKLDPDKLEHRLSQWLGYGDIDGEIWLLGMEEGGSTSFEEAKVRIDLPAVSNIREFHRRLHKETGMATRWFTENAILQSTYAPLIRILLCALGKCGYDQPVSSRKDKDQLRERIRDYQRDRFGKEDEGILVTELLPLSNQSVADWEYHRFTDRKDLQSRDTYEEIWKPKRLELLSKLYEEKQPSLVIAYGKSNWDEYTKILSEDENHYTREIIPGIARRVGPMVLIQHPVSKGIKNKTWEEIGHYIKEQFEISIF